MDAFRLPSVICYSIKMGVCFAILPPPLLWTAEDRGDRLAQVDSQDTSAKMVWGHPDIMAVLGG